MKETFNYEHAVGSTLDYGLNWLAKGWLSAGETIVSSTWTVTGPGAVKSSEQNLNGVTSLFLYLPTVDIAYRVKNTITTSAGRTDSRTLHILTARR